MEQTIRKRRVKLITAIIVMLFTGIIYAWSITKTPFIQLSDGIVTNATQLGINYTITIIFFCLGGFAAGLISKQTSPALRLVLSALMLFTSYMSASLQTVTLSYTGNYFLLYMTCGVLGGLGIGMAYVTVISTVNMWYPEKRGFSSGMMMMSFGLSLLIIGWLIDLSGSSEAVGWRTTYVLIAIILGVILITAAALIKPPPQGTIFPALKQNNASNKNSASMQNNVPDHTENNSHGYRERREFSALQMIKRPSFILIFLYITILATSGSAAISFAKDIITDTGATERFAVIAVGLLGISNGIGRLAIGWMFDKIGIRQTQFISSATAIFAPLTVVMALAANSVILGVVGLCLCGFSYGFAPTTSSVLTSEFYGTHNFTLNFSIMNLILIPAPFAAMLAGSIKTSTGGFMTAFIILTGLTVVGFFLNLAIRKP